MRRILSIALVALAVATLASAQKCAQNYGCSAAIIGLSSGGFVLHGFVNVPMTWYPKPPATDAVIASADGERTQEIQIRWWRVDYVCCCPSEWAGEYAEVLGFEVEPGEMLWLRVADGALCEQEIQVPLHPQNVCLDPLAIEGGPATLGQPLGTGD